MAARRSLWGRAMASCTARPPASSPNSAGPGPGKRAGPEKTALHQVVAADLESSLRYTRDNDKRPLPRYAELDLRRLLPCSLLH